MIEILVLIIVIGYLFGSIPMGYLYCKSKGINIFEVGSKNPGSTNVGRVLGHKEGVKVFLLDILKTIVAIIVCVIIVMIYTKICYERGDSFGFPYNTLRKLTIFYTGCGTVLGHNFPIFTKFRGGKGITCTVAVIFCFSVIYALLLYVIHKIIGKVTRYVSVASIITLLILLISSIALIRFNIYPYNFPYANYSIPALLFITLFGILRHTSNIKRLIKGTENKL